MGVRMQKLGVAGVLVDGRVRDLGEIRGVGLPLWARGTSTVGTGAEAKAGFRGVRVEVGGVGVEPVWYLSFLLFVWLVFWWVVADLVGGYYFL